MQALKAHVENGQVVVDEPMDFPDGTVLRIEAADGLDAEERQQILHAIDAGREAARRGEHVDAEAFIDELGRRERHWPGPRL